MRILILEDEADIRQLFVDILRDEGHHCDAAAHIAQARTLLGNTQLHYDVVVSDCSMPLDAHRPMGCAPHELVEEFRHHVTRGTRIIICSAESMLADRESTFLHSCGVPHQVVNKDLRELESTLAI